MRRVESTRTSSTLSIAHLYDPAIGVWSPTRSLVTVRYQHTATVLPIGKVLVTGGTGGISFASNVEGQVLQSYNSFGSLPRETGSGLAILHSVCWSLGRTILETICGER